MYNMCRLDGAFCVIMCRGVYERNVEEIGSINGAIKGSWVNAHSCRCEQTLDQAGKGNQEDVEKE